MTAPLEIHRSPYNEEVSPQSPPAQVGIYDTTLRDGEQTVGVVFRKDEKLRIARALDEAGVPRIEAGMPVVSDEDFEAVREIVLAVRRAQVWAFCRCRRDDIDAALRTGARFAVCEIPVSALKFRAWGFQPDDVLRRIATELRYARQQGLYAAFFAVDATRADPEFLRRSLGVAVNEGGAREIVLADTLGVTTPEGMERLTRLVRQWVDASVMVHCHNDFGLAVACSLAGLRAGAQWVHVTVNGLGERSGNADLAEVVMTLELFYGVRTGIALDQLVRLSDMVAEMSGIRMPPFKAVVGRDLFRKESGATVAQLLSFPPSVESFPASLIGRQSEVVLGKKSGAASVRHRLSSLGLAATDEQVSLILREVKSRAQATKGLVSDAEFEEIVRSMFGGNLTLPARETRWRRR